MLLIGLSGKARSGKDSVAAIMANSLRQLGYNVQIKSLAEPVKAAYCAASQITLAEMNANKETHRPALQELGASRRRENPLHWINILWGSIPHDQQIVILPDIRYENEYKWVQQKLGLVFRVERDEVLRAQHGVLTNKYHESEVALDTVKACGWHQVFYNNGSMHDLTSNVENWIGAFKNRIPEWVGQGISKNI